MNITAADAYKRANEAALRLELPYRAAAEKFIEEVVEPAIGQACADGKFEACVEIEDDRGEYFLGGAIRILEENGFDARIEPVNLLLVSWDN